MTKEELYNIKGGTAISAALINAVIRGVVTIADLGRSVGTAIRRILSGSSCPIK